MEQVYYQSHRGASSQEMSQKPTRDAFFTFNHKTYGMRPISVATEFVDTDWEEEDDYSDTEENNNSPRVSLQSGQPSFTTVSSYDEVSTPRTSRDGFNFSTLAKPVEGPHGPHLFRSSVEYPPTVEDDIILSLSPITPKVPRGVPVPFHRSLPPPRRNSPFKYTSAELQKGTLPQWTPEMVAQSMLNAGIEQPVADRFIENDITGAILITLKFEDLKELDIQSFGIRTTVWHQIQALRDRAPVSPRPPTPIEDEPSREARKETGKHDDAKPKRRPSTSASQRKKSSASDTIMPGDSVSIIGIEQVVPKPHVCSKGENCSKWRKQQRLIERFMKLNPTIDINANAGGKVMIVGDAGNPDTARALDPNENWRPFSDAVPSVVASSDVLGTDGTPPLQYLQEVSLREASLRNIDRMDTQDNVRQFLRFQQSNPNDVPPTPPYEVAPQAPHQGLRRLPRLSIPSAPQPPRPQPPRAATVSPRMQLYAEQRGEQYHEECTSPQEFVPYQMEKADPRSPDLETRHNPYRFGTPFSEMDVPVTAVPLGPVARDTSQSVPPDMSYRHGHANPQRAQSRTSRRPSFPVLPALDENKPVRTTSQTTSPQAPSPPKVAPRRQAQAQSQPQPLHAPPRANYPWSPVERRSFEQVLPPSSTFDATDGPSSDSGSSHGISHQGPMKKRKTKFLRHEWHDGYFTVKGTRLNMHKDAEQLDRTLEYVDIDDYAIACSSLASTSKLSAAFKAVSISHNRNKSNPVGAFQFQLIPMEKEKTSAKLRKRESAVSAKGAAAEGVNGTGKTHHFAVTSRDDRIDWMRELMLAKTRKQKQEGFEVKVNGADMI
uniref:PH domain-containing protein n=1 Tax=Bionectria ochroleuca TaxID=29856 RepID=A0A8H7N9B4_BIOOC